MVEVIVVFMMVLLAFVTVLGGWPSGWLKTMNGFS